MIAKSMKQFTANSSAVRAMFEAGAEMAKEVGAENVYDFSLGNPNVPAPEALKDAIETILEEMPSKQVHGYMSNAGHESVRKKIAEKLNREQGTAFSQNNILMTVGAAGALNVALKTILDPLDEVICIAPYFVEYGAYAANYGAVVKTVPADTESFQINFKALEATITPKTRAVIINSPNNPSGVVYSVQSLKCLARLLTEKSAAYGSEIFIIADEPYRDLVYDGIEVPYVTPFYNNTLVCYSWSKSLSLPGERIGYLVVPSEINDYDEMWNAFCVANRVLGFVNAPSLMQLAVGECLDLSCDIAYYDRNRQTLYSFLTEMGYTCVMPQGAFYLWMKAPGGDDKLFCKKAFEEHILMVPGSSFACPGYVRLAYCVDYETILRSKKAFETLIKKY